MSGRDGGLMVVFRKEMLEVLRDRKTLVFMIVLPLALLPLIMRLFTGYMIEAEKKAASETIEYAVFGAEHAPGLAEALAEAPGFAAVELGSPEALASALEAEDLDLGIVVPAPDAPDAQIPDAQIEVQLHFDNAKLTSKVKKRAEAALEVVADTRRRARLEAAGIEGFEAQAAVLEPLVIVERGTATARERLGEAFGGILPYMLIPFCFLGALYPAIDLGAGEKERGTLETLLLAPVPRSRIVLGKFLVVFTTGVVAALLTVVGLGAWLAIEGPALGGDMGEVLRTIGALDLGLVAVMLLPTTAMFAALLLCISIYAKSFKEAQSYAAPLNLLVILPAVFAMLPGVELDWTWAMVPVTNVALAIKELVKGTIDYTMLVAILGSSTAVAAALLWATTKWFERESVLFRQ
jgi:sodium transport system permease protein